MRGLIFVACALFGCGNAIGPGDTLVYAKLQGTIGGAPIAPAAPVRVALLWYLHVGDEAGGHVVEVAQDFPIRVAFPSAFSIDLTTLPPAAALAGGVATGAPIVYEDTNDNGSLDFTAPSDTDFRDHLLGTLTFGAQSDSILYAESDAAGYPRGFSVLDTTVAADGSLSDADEPIDTPLSIELSADPALSCYLVTPLPAKLPMNGAGLGYEADFCAGNAAPAGSTIACGPYKGAPFYQAFTPVPTSSQIEATCGTAYEVCLIAGSPPASLSCPS